MSITEIPKWVVLHTCMSITEMPKWVVPGGSSNKNKASSYPQYLGGFEKDYHIAPNFNNFVIFVRCKLITKMLSTNFF